MTRPDYDQNELISMQGEASGLYRREYGTWAAEIGCHVKGPDGFEKSIPGRTLIEHSGGDYDNPPDPPDE